MNYLIVNNRWKLDGSIRYIHSFAFISHQNNWLKIVVSLYWNTEMIRKAEEHMKIWKSVDPNCIHFHFVWFFGSTDFRFTCTLFRKYRFLLILFPAQYLLQPTFIDVLVPVALELITIAVVVLTWEQQYLSF